MRNALQKVNPSHCQGTLQQRFAIARINGGRFAPAANGDWMRILNILRDHGRRSALFAGAVILSTIVVTALIKPVYEPSAQLEIGPPAADFYNTENSGSSPAGEEYLFTQAKNLESDDLAVAVIRKFHLDRNPEFAGFRAHQAQQQGATSANATTGDQVTPVLSAAENAALFKFRRHLKVQRDTASRIVTVRFASHDPELAAEVANGLLQTFVDRTYDRRREGIAQRSEWLSSQLEDVKKKLEASLAALTDFQKRTGIVDVNERTNTFSEQLAELGRQKTLAQSDRVSLSSILQNGKTPEVFSAVQNNPVVQELSKKLAETRAELEQAKAIYGVNHPNVRKLQSQAVELHIQLDGQREAILRSLQANYAAAATREHALNRVMKSASKDFSRIAQYNTLKKDVETNTNLYNDLYKRIKEAGIAAGARTTDMQIVDPARILDRPSRPNWWLNLTGGVLLALVGGVLLAFASDTLNRRLRSIEDVRYVVEGANVSWLPVVTMPKISKPGLNLLPAGEMIPERLYEQQPFSPGAEAFRTLNTSLLLSRAERQQCVILVTSPLPGEGKTTVCTNLATVLSRHGKTCLIDADLRAPRVATALALEKQEPSLSFASPMTCLQSVPNLPNLKVLVLAEGTDWDPTTMFGSEAMREMIQELRGDFSSIVIDSPPLLPFADARLLSVLVDGVMLVCRWGVTTPESLHRSWEILKEVNGAPVMEVVLNGAEVSTEHYYGYYRAQWAQKNLSGSPLPRQDSSAA